MGGKRLVNVCGRKTVCVPTTIRKLDLLKQAYEKLCAHDSTFDRHADYTLAFPDGTKVLTLPDHPNHIFHLDEYQQEVGKPYNRITLFLLKRVTKKDIIIFSKAKGTLVVIWRKALSDR